MAKPETTTAVPLWEQQTGESARAYEAFRTYRDLEPSARSIRRVAQELGKSATLVGRWSSTCRWVERAEAWDREQDRLWQADLRARRRTIVDRHLRVAQAAQGKIVQRLVGLDAEKLTVVELIRLLEVASRIERDALAVGQPVQLHHEISNSEASPLTVQLAEFAAMGAEQRRLAIADMAAAVSRRVQAATGADDDDD